MKDELSENSLLEVIGLRAKAYSYKELVLYTEPGNDENAGYIVEIKKLKGIKKCVVRKIFVLSIIIIIYWKA